MSSLLPSGGECMTVQDRRFIANLFLLLQDCGMPDKTPHASLIHEIYWMIEEYAEDYGVDLE
jgi:hypothetical protein